MYSRLSQNVVTPRYHEEGHGLLRHPESCRKPDDNFRAAGYCGGYLNGGQPVVWSGVADPFLGVLCSGAARFAVAFFATGFFPAPFLAAAFFVVLFMPHTLQQPAQSGQ
jgi:hypothetical protein